MANYLAKRDIENVSLENVDEQRKGQIISIKNGIQLSYENTLEFAGDASKNLTEFSSDLLKTMKVKDTPEVEWAPVEDWVSVNEFGAVGDGITDDTEAIRKAFASGKSTVYFQPGQYLLDDVVEIPATLQRINFMYCDIVSGEKLKQRKHTGNFLIKEDSPNPVIIEDLFAWEKYNGFMTLVEHACKRTVIFSDVHVQAASIYFNTVPGAEIYMENTGCTIGGIPGAGWRRVPLPNEDWNSYSRETPCFYFEGQEVYCRQLNPERSLHEVVNNGGKLWVLGGKTEEEGTAFETINGGYTEVLGVVFALAHDLPLIVNDNSNVSVYASVFCMCHCILPIPVREIQNGQTKELGISDVPYYALGNYVIPLYIGRNTEDGSKGSV